MKEKLEMLISHPQLVEEYGKTAKARVQKAYSWDKLAGDTAKLYLSVLGRG